MCIILKYITFTTYIIILCCTILFLFKKVLSISISKHIHLYGNALPVFLRLFVIAFPRNPAYASARFVTFVLAWACFMKVTMFYLMYMGVLVFVLVANRYDGCFNGYDYDCCKNRLSDRFYPSLVKPFPYYYRCVNRRVVYGRCGANRCVT